MAGFYFHCVFFFVITQVADPEMTEQGIVIKVELGIKANECAVGGFNQRVDFQQGTVRFNKCSVKVHQNRDGLLDLGHSKAKFEGDFACLESGQSDGGINRFKEQFFRSFFRNLFDVYPSFGGGHQGHFVGGTVNQERNIEFISNVASLFNQNPLNNFTFRAGLMGDETHAEHISGVLFNFIGGFGNFNSATFTASSGMDLCFNCPGAVTKSFCPVAGRVTVVDYVPFWNRHSEVAQNRFCLILVNVHCVLTWLEKKAGFVTFRIPKKEKIEL